MRGRTNCKTMTKNIFSVLCLMGFMVAPLVGAQEVEADTEAVNTDKKARKTNALSKARKLKPRFAKLPKSADYLMICKFSAEDDNAGQLLDDIGDATGKLKSSKVALLMLCEDESSKKAAKMMKAAKLKVATVFTASLPEGVEDASDYLPETMDTVTLVDMNGETVCSGDSSLVNSWKEELEKKEAAKNWETLTIDPKRYPVAAALKNLDSQSIGTFDPTADYYIYLFSASWCGPCRALMPEIIKTVYPEIRQSRKPKVELILAGCDSTIAGVTKYREHYDADFFAFCSRSPQARNVPGLDAGPDFIPSCVIVDKSGKVIHSGGGAAVKNWKNIIQNAR